MAGWHYDLFLVATGPVEIGMLTSRLSSQLTSLTSPAPALLLWGSADGDRVDFWTNHSPMQLLARLDLRTPSDSFRRLLLETAREFGLTLVNVDDVEIEPTNAALLADITASAAQAFVSNPPADHDEDDPA